MTDWLFIVAMFCFSVGINVIMNTFVFRKMHRTIAINHVIIYLCERSKLYSKMGMIGQGKIYLTLANEINEIREEF